MADWTNIQNAAIDPGSPGNQALFTALRDNPKAIAEGADGAPSIEIPALQSLTAGDTIRVEKDDVQDRTGTTNNTAFDIQLCQTGAVRLTLQHRRAVSGSGSAILDVLFNESIVQTYTTSSTSFTTRTVNLTLTNTFNRIRVQQRGSSSLATSEVRNIRLMTAGEIIWPGPPAGGNYGTFVG